MSFNDSLSSPKSPLEFPQITLRKGNTEIKIKDPTTLIRKIEELFPKGVNKDLHSELIARELTKKKIEYGIGQTSPFEDPLLVIPNETPESPSNTEIRTVNKNAYEIRLDVLKEAIQWLTICGIPTTIPSSGEEMNISTSFRTGDEVISLAKKFYAFVENRR